MNEKYISPAQRIARQSETSQTGKKELLIKKGMEIAMKKGISKTSINDITTACNVAKGTFYYYFENKEDYIKAAVMGLNIQDVYNELSSMNDMSIIEKIRYYNFAYAKKMYEEIGWDFCHIWSQIVIEYQSTERLEEDLRQMQSILESGVDSGEIQKDADCRKIAWMIVTYIYGAAFIWHICNEKMTVVKLIEMFNEQIEGFLAPVLIKR